jgi:hypothetical protein
MAVKGNQPRLHDGIKAFFDDYLEYDFARVKARHSESQEKGQAGNFRERCYRDREDAKRD